MKCISMLGQMMPPLGSRTRLERPWRATLWGWCPRPCVSQLSPEPVFEGIGPYLRERSCVCFLDKTKREERQRHTVEVVLINSTLLSHPSTAKM